MCAAQCDGINAVSIRLPEQAGDFSLDQMRGRRFPPEGFFGVVGQMTRTVCDECAIGSKLLTKRIHIRATHGCSGSEQPDDAASTDTGSPANGWNAPDKRSLRAGFS